MKLFLADYDAAVSIGRSTSLARLFVRLSDCPSRVRASNSKTNRRRKIKICAKFLQDRSGRCVKR